MGFFGCKRSSGLTISDYLTGLAVMLGSMHEVLKPGFVALLPLLYPSKSSQACFRRASTAKQDLPNHSSNPNVIQGSGLTLSEFKILCLLSSYSV